MLENPKIHVWGGDDIPGGILKTWSSTQASIAQSSGEAEYYALVRAASEALGMKSIMNDLGWDCKIRLLVDSSAAKSIASRTGLGKLRHLEIKFLWLQECVRRGKVIVSKVRGEVNPADVLTKPKSLEDMRVLLNFSCIDWHNHGWAPSTCYGGDRVGYEGQSVFSNGRIQFVNGVFNSVRSCRRGVVGSGVVGSGVVCRDSSRGHSIDPFHCTQPHCIPSAGHPQSGYYLNRNC